MPSYDHYLANLQQHFAEINICTHPSSVAVRVPDRFVHVASNVDYASTNYTSQVYANITQPYAVFFSSGICETEFVGIEPFKTHIPNVVKFVYESCMGAIPAGDDTSVMTKRAAGETFRYYKTDSFALPCALTFTYHYLFIENENIFFIKLEEVVDPSLHFFDALNEANDFMLNTVVARLNQRLLPLSITPITVLDTYHVTRSWKLFEPRTDIDRMHYYAEHVYHGNHVSNTAMNMILLKVAQTMERNLQGSQRSALRDTSLSVDTKEYPDRTVHGRNLFPAYSALPALHIHEVVPFEGRLLQSPHNKREIFFVHEGNRCSLCACILVHFGAACLLASFCRCKTTYTRLGYVRRPEYGRAQRDSLQ